MKRIIYQNESGNVSVIVPTGELSIQEVAAKDVPQGVAYEIVDASVIPSDRFFRAAWKLGNGCVEHDLDQCKTIGHEKRRAMRAEEFKPHDEVIALQIPGKNAAAAETERQKIRTKYEAMQNQIDAATTPEEIKSALGL